MATFYIPRDQDWCFKSTPEHKFDKILDYIVEMGISNPEKYNGNSTEMYYGIENTIIQMHSKPLGVNLTNSLSHFKKGDAIDYAPTQYKLVSLPIKGNLKGNELFWYKGNYYLTVLREKTQNCYSCPIHSDNTKSCNVIRTGMCNDLMVIPFSPTIKYTGLETEYDVAQRTINIPPPDTIKVTTETEQAIQELQQCVHPHIHSSESEVKLTYNKSHYQIKI